LDNILSKVQVFFEVNITALMEEGHGGPGGLAEKVMAMMLLAATGSFAGFWGYQAARSAEHQNMLDPSVHAVPGMGATESHFWFGWGGAENGHRHSAMESHDFASIAVVDGFGDERSGGVG
jgi:hypothetical protein